MQEPLHNAKHEAVCLKIAQGLNYALAYKEVYNSKTLESASSCATKLIAKPEVRDRVEALKSLSNPFTSAPEITEGIALEGLRVEATRTGPGTSHSARVSAWKAIRDAKAPPKDINVNHRVLVLSNPFDGSQAKLGANTDSPELPGGAGDLKELQSGEKQEIDLGSHNHIYSTEQPNCDDLEIEDADFEVETEK